MQMAKYSMHVVFYSNLFVPSNFGATTYGPFIIICPKYKGDEGLLRHELEHVKQFWHNPLFGLWYKFSKKSRLKYEAEAYKEQLKYYPVDKTVVFAGYLVDKYNLGITLEEAVLALS